MLYTYIVDDGIISILDLVKLFSFNPSRIIKVPNKGHLSIGADADIVVFDPNEEFIIDERFFVSKSRNSCFLGMKAKGKVKLTFVNGNLVFSD
jgi:dihydroorotase